jgi:asparagine synthase (glutamine-hydrolysing)
MSALAGMVRLDGGPADPSAVARMIDCVAHRGGDFREVRADGAVTLAYRRHQRAVAQPVDEQPLCDRLARVALVFDGRLDNRPDLAGDLDLRDDVSVPDAAIVLAAHRRWGRDMLPRLLGDFALALWDGRERRLTLARDPRGVRSLAYAVAGGCVVFATEARQLLRIAQVDARPNLGFFAERLSGVVSHQSDTIFSGIQRVPAAHAVVVTSAGVSVVRHWDIDPAREIRYADEAEYAEQFRELLTRAVAVRLRGLDRAAVLLSSGVDSSSVVATAAHANAGGRPAEIRTYNHSLPDYPDADEEAGARRVAAHCGVPFTAVPFQAASIQYQLDRAARLEDTTPGSLGSSDDVLAAGMTGDGCQVVLSGVGGDEWFAGAYLHSADLIRRGRVVAGVRQLWADARNPDTFHGLGVLARTCGWALMPDGVRRAVKRARPSPDRTPSGFNRAFAYQVSLADRVALAPLEGRFPSLAAAAVYRGATHAHGVYAWEESTRQASLYGCEFSAPLLDRRIAEFAMAIPEEQRWSGRETKRVLRAAMAGMLPDDVRVGRHKVDPGAAVFAQVGRLHAEGALARMELADAGILDTAAVDGMYRDMVRLFAGGRARYKVLAYRLWTLFAGECVWRTVFGRQARVVSANVEREGVSGAETPAARCG